MKLKKRTLSLVIVLTMVATLFVPITASAAETATWDPPTEAMEVDPDIVKVAGHAANTTAVHYLGGDLVTARSSDLTKGTTEASSAAEKLAAASTITELGAFGSSINVSPDPYWWNYFYNLYDAANNDGENQAPASDTVQLVSANPMGADLTPVSGYENLTVSGTDQVPHSVGMKPDVFLGINGSGGKTYDDYLILMKDYVDNGGDWNPIQVNYKATDLNDFIEDMYNLSEAIVKSGKEGRYGDTEAIAKNYEAYIKGLQLYVMKQIDDGKVDKKTVAIVDPETLSDGHYQAYNSSMSKGTAASCRAAEYVENTTNNIIDTEGIENTGTAASPQYLATAEQITKADAIFITVQAQINMSEEQFASELAEAAGVEVEELPPIYAYDPNGAFSIRANSVENFVGIGQYQGFLYPEVINPVYAAAYVYQNFYHLNEADYKALTQYALSEASLPEGYDGADTAGYTKEYIDDRIAEGIQYYKNNVGTYEDTKLALTEDYDRNIDRSIDFSRVTISAIANQMYTGKALTPAITVKDGEKVLKNGTDYTVTYRNNVNKGRATVTVTGKGTYKGQKTVYFNIVSKSITGATVSAIGTKTYNGRVQRPAVTVKLGTTTLKNNTDYKVAYSTNKNPGKATVTITGAGNYAGTKKVTFKIKPKKATVRKTKTYKKRKLKVTWKRDSLATGYQVVVGTNAKVTKNKKVINVTRNKTTSKTFKKLKRGKRYYVKVRSYKKVDGKKLYGAYSKVKRSAKIKR